MKDPRMINVVDVVEAERGGILEIGIVQVDIAVGSEFKVLERRVIHMRHQEIDEIEDEELARLDIDRVDIKTGQTTAGMFIALEADYGIGINAWAAFGVKNKATIMRHTIVNETLFPFSQRFLDIQMMSAVMFRCYSRLPTLDEICKEIGYVPDTDRRVGLDAAEIAAQIMSVMIKLNRVALKATHETMQQIGLLDDDGKD